MAVRVTCPHCFGDLRLPEELYDDPAECPLCRGGFAVVWRQRTAAVPKSTPIPAILLPPEPAALRPCRYCGELIKTMAKRCPHCGQGQETEPADKS